MKKTLLCLILCCALCVSFLPAALGEDAGEHHVVNVIAGDEPVSFAEDAKLLTVVFPAIAGCDCAILTYGDQVMMIDGAHESMASRCVLPALQAMGITHVDIAFITHPHADHMEGFLPLAEAGITFDRIILFFDEDYDYWMTTRILRPMIAQGGKPERMKDGDEFYFGDARVQIAQRIHDRSTTNDKSGICMITYGERTIFFTGDIENVTQQDLIERPPVFPLKADILKHPHHAYAKIDTDLLKTVDPELIIVTGIKSGIDPGINFLNEKKVPWLRPWPRALQMQTDGKTWVVDYPEWAEPMGV